MSYGLAVILLGAVVMGAAVLSPMLMVGGDAGSHRRKQRLSGVAAISAFACLSLLYAYADRLDNPPPPKPPPRVTGRDIDAELITPGSRSSTGRSTPRGARIEPSGFGTILAAPQSEGKPEPFPTNAPIAGLRAGDPEIAPEIRHLIRLLPRVRERPPVEWTELTTLEMPAIVTGTVILRDGCFRLAGPGELLVLLPAHTRAVLDDAGYLILGPPGTARGMAGRVGETMWWYAPTMRVTNPAVTGPLRRTCRPGQVVRVGTGSEALHRREGDEGTARTLSNMYGMSYEEARSRVAACQADADRRRVALRDRYGENAARWPNDLAPGPCTGSPPPPVIKASDCPPNTKHSSGLCRNAEGFVVPLPSSPPSSPPF